jgi:hypothetical protein
MRQNLFVACCYRAAKNKDSDKQLNIALNLEAINVIKIFFKLYNQAINLHFHALSLIKISYSPQTTPCTSLLLKIIKVRTVFSHVCK